MKQSTPPKIVIAPQGIFEGIAKGKEYKVVGIWDDNIKDGYGYGFIITNERGLLIICLERKCSHINDGNWIIKEREGDATDYLKPVK